MSEDMDFAKRQKQQEEFAVKDLFKERRTHKKNDLSFMQPESVTEETQEEEVQTPVLGYDEMLKRIKDQDYDKKGLLKWKRSSSEEMSAITEHINSIQELTKLPVSMEDFDAHYKLIKEQYEGAIERCRTYLSKKHPKTDEGKARYALVERIGERMMSELRTMDFNKEVYKKTGVEKDTKWIDVITDMARLTLKNNVDGVKIHGKEEGQSGGTSDLKIIEDGEKKYFFKKEEKICECDPESVIQFMLKDYKEEIRQLMLKKEGAYPDLDDDVREARINKIALKAKMINTIAPSNLNTLINKLKKEGTYEKKKSAINGSFTTVDNMRGGSMGEGESKWQMVRALALDNTEYVADVGRYKKMTLSEEELKAKEAFVEAFSEYKRIGTLAAEARVARIDPGTEVSKRNEATSIMADLMGISDMMMVSKRVRLNMDDKDVDGLRMDAVQGGEYFDILSREECLDKTVHMSTKALSQMLTLQVFDIICGQIDRNKSNFLMQHKVVNGEVIIENLTGIDNDLSFGKLTYNQTITKETDYKTTSVSTTGKSLEDKNGEIKLFGLDKKVADRILAITPEVIELSFKGLLSEDEVNACKDRLKGVQQVILRMKKEDEKAKKEGKPTRLLDTDKEWEALRDRLEKQANENNAVLTANSYLHKDFMGKKLTQYVDFPKWNAFRKLKKEQFYSTVGPFYESVEKRDLAELKKLYPTYDMIFARNDDIHSDQIREAWEKIRTVTEKEEPKDEEEKKAYWKELEDAIQIIKNNEG